MSAHTPGPWHRVKPMGARHWTLGKISEHVARPLPEENEEADWRLAEAAPDLLAALRVAVMRLARVDGGDSVVIAGCLEAIAAATGEDFDFEAAIAEEDAKARGE